MEYMVTYAYSQPSHLYCVESCFMSLAAPHSICVDVTREGEESVKRSTRSALPSISGVFLFLEVQNRFHFQRKGKIKSVSLLRNNINRLNPKNRVLDFSFFMEKICFIFCVLPDAHVISLKDLEQSDLKLFWIAI